MKNLQFKRLSVFLLIFSLFAGVAMAQPAFKAKERIRLLKKIKLMEILKLDEKASEQFLAKYSSWENKIEAKMDQLEKSQDDLEKAIRKNASNDDLSRKTQENLKLVDELNDLHIQKIKAMKSMLNDKEYAKLVLFEGRFKKELQKAIMQFKGNNPKESKKRRKSEMNFDGK